MKLKNKLYLQNIFILLITLAITLTVTLLYGNIYEKTSTNHTPGISDTGLIVIERDGDIVFSNGELSESQLKGAVMDINSGKTTVQIAQMRYLVSADSFENNGSIYTLTPIFDLSAYYTNLAAVLITVFSLTFCLCALYIARSNKKNIAEPLISLKESTDMLTSGELDLPVQSQGEAEIRDLCDSVEKLRLKLKESIYYREKADDNRKFLLSGISHDLRTPIAGAKGYLEGLIDGIADTPEKRKSYLTSALSKVNTINSMIDDLLLYSKLDLNSILIESENVELNGFLSEYAESLQSDFANSKKTICFISSVDTAYVSIDKIQFKRVLQNIITNAEKHIYEETGRIEILLREASGSVIIEIKDNGCGISKEDLPNIFNRFYRGNTARTNDGSSGLGLPIAKQIIENTGGLIWALSEEGKGTSIMISLKKQRN